MYALPQLCAQISQQAPMSTILHNGDAPLASRTAWRDATEKASDPQKRILNRSFCRIPEEVKCRVTTGTFRAPCSGCERVRHRVMQSINSCGSD
jgi:hypothetical protein